MLIVDVSRGVDFRAESLYTDDGTLMMFQHVK